MDDVEDEEDRDQQRYGYGAYQPVARQVYLMIGNLSLHLLCVINDGQFGGIALFGLCNGGIEQLEGLCGYRQCRVVAS